jgi:hypothetical protein
MKKKVERLPLTDTRDLMMRFDRLLGRMAPKVELAPASEQPAKAFRRGKQKRKPEPTSPGIS